MRTVELRITATGNIAKITKAMKMVAAAKLRAVQDKNELARPFTDGARDFLEPYAEVMDEISEADVLKHVIVPITGDRGLCGGINTNIAKYVKAMVDQDSNSSTTSGSARRKWKKTDDSIMPMLTKQMRHAKKGLESPPSERRPAPTEHAPEPPPTPTAASAPPNQPDISHS